MIGIVLAAGLGVRVGGPKALLVLDGISLVTLHCMRLLEVGCRDVVAVLRADVAARVVLPPRARLALSAADDPAGSLVAGLSATTSTDDETVFIAPVDVLPALPETLLILARALQAGAEAATPRRNGVSGHPIAVRSRALMPYRHSLTPRLRDVLDGLGERRVRVPVDDDAVTSEINVPADAQRVLGRSPVFVQ